VILLGALITFHAHSYQDAPFWSHYEKRVFPIGACLSGQFIENADKLVCDSRELLKLLPKYVPLISMLI
jgi:hypothetical protein